MYLIVLVFLVADMRLHLAAPVGTSVTNFVEFQAIFALALLPNRPGLDCRASGLVLVACYRVISRN